MFDGRFPAALDPPDCVVLMGDSIGEEIVDVYDQIRELNGDRFVNIAVLAERQAGFVENSNRRALTRDGAADHAAGAAPRDSLSVPAKNEDEQSSDAEFLTLSGRPG